MWSEVVNVMRGHCSTQPVDTETWQEMSQRDFYTEKIIFYVILKKKENL